MKRINRLRVAVGVLALCFSSGSMVEAQKPIRVGASVREAILKMDLNTVFGPFKVDQDGFQIAQMLLFQWQNGKKVMLWPEGLAPGKPRFPTPPWNQRP